MKISSTPACPTAGPRRKSSPFPRRYETVANGLAWTWYLLSQNPEVESKLHTELDTFSHRPPTTPSPPGRLPSLRYTSKSLPNPCASTHPLGPWPHVHQTHQPRPLPHSTRSSLLLQPYIISRTPEYFPNPLRFDPDRFTPEKQSSRPRFTYFPFGGATASASQSFAWMEGVFSIATIAQRWSMSYLGTTPPIPQAKITSAPDPLMMQLTPR